MVSIRTTLFSVTRKRKIADKLDTIALLFVAKALYTLFRKTIEGLLINKADKSQLLTIVSQIAKEITAEGRVDMAIPLTYDKRKAQVKILQNGLLSLNTLQPGFCSLEEQRDAILLDEEEFQDPCNRLPQQRTNAIQVHDMVKPTTTPLVLPTYLITCRAVLNYLRIENLAVQPEMWVRRTHRHKLTTERISWKWVKPGKTLEGHLEFVDCARDNLIDYTVILKHQNGRDIPVPLAIPRPNSPCCNGNCKIVQRHLKNLWGCDIHAAKRIQNSEGEDVLTQLFDTDQFGIRCNDLCVYVA